MYGKMDRIWVVSVFHTFILHILLFYSGYNVVDRIYEFPIKFNFRPGWCVSRSTTVVKTVPVVTIVYFYVFVVMQTFNIFWVG